MRRRLFTLCSIVSLALCVAACVLWARSNRIGHEDQFGWVFRGDRYTFRSHRAEVKLYAPPTYAAHAAPATRDLVNSIRNADLLWMVAAADPEFTTPLWVVGMPRGRAAELRWPGRRLVQTAPAPDIAGRTTLLLGALEDPERFVVAHYGLRELQKFQNGRPDSLLGVAGYGGLRCDIDGMRVELAGGHDPRVDSSDTHFADFTGTASIDQLPVIREQWHRQLDREVGFLPWWVLAASTAVLPLLSVAGLAYSRTRARSRRRAGLCTACGFDLRATPNRCPECGAVPPARRNRIDRIVADHERGALTDAEACLGVLIAVGESDDATAAATAFARLTPALRERVSRLVAKAEPNEARIIESYNGPASPEEYAADLRRRETAMRMGIAVLQRLNAAVK